MLRRIALKPPPNTSISDDIVYWMTVGTETRAFAEQELLHSLVNEGVGAVRRKVCDAIAELAKYMMAKGRKEEKTRL
jgi:hypothetical protein